MAIDLVPSLKTESPKGNAIAQTLEEAASTIKRHLDKQPDSARNFQSMLLKLTVILPTTINEAYHSAMQFLKQYLSEDQKGMSAAFNVLNNGLGPYICSYNLLGGKLTFSADDIDEQALATDFLFSTYQNRELEVSTIDLLTYLPQHSPLVVALLTLIPDAKLNLIDDATQEGTQVLLKAIDSATEGFEQFGLSSDSMTTKLSKLIMDSSIPSAKIKPGSEANTPRTLSMVM